MVGGHVGPPDPGGGQHRDGILKAKRRRPRPPKNGPHRHGSHAGDTCPIPVEAVCMCSIRSARQLVRDPLRTHAAAEDFSTLRGTNMHPNVGCIAVWCSHDHADRCPTP